MIGEYHEKKLVEYLEPGQRVLIRFGHGWGDTLMFMPIFRRLQDLYAEVNFDLYLEAGQEEIFKTFPDKEGPDHDHVFHLDFPMAEGSGLTKAQKCCIDELGIDPLSEVEKLAKVASPIVAVHFQGTALPNSVNCPEEVARKIWQETLDAGKIPIEAHFRHLFHNPVNTRYGFVDRHVRYCNANLSNLIGLIQTSFAFIGVASGPFVTALSIMPTRTLYLERNHAVTDYVKHLDIRSVHVDHYEEGMVSEWLTSLS